MKSIFSVTMWQYKALDFLPASLWTITKKTRATNHPVSTQQWAWRREQKYHYISPMQFLFTDSSLNPGATLKPCSLLRPQLQYHSFHVEQLALTLDFPLYYALIRMPQDQTARYTHRFPMMHWAVYMYLLLFTPHVLLPALHVINSCLTVLFILVFPFSSPHSADGWPCLTLVQGHFLFKGSSSHPAFHR